LVCKPTIKQTMFGLCFNHQTGPACVTCISPITSSRNEQIIKLEGIKVIINNITPLILSPV